MDLGVAWTHGQFSGTVLGSSATLSLLASWRREVHSPSSGLKKEKVSDNTSYILGGCNLRNKRLVPIKAWSETSSSK